MKEYENLDAAVLAISVDSFFHPGKIQGIREL